ncbi:MAG TPA: hypothetical protein VF796_13965 [Humisphaera sp.]
MRVPRPVRWLLIVLGLAAGWAAGNLLDDARAAKEAAAPRPPRPPATTRSIGP